MKPPQRRIALEPHHRGRFHAREIKRAFGVIVGEHSKRSISNITRNASLGERLRDRLATLSFAFEATRHELLGERHIIEISTLFEGLDHRVGALDIQPVLPEQRARL